jgi:hypothetical protein
MYTCVNYNWFEFTVTRMEWLPPLYNTYAFAYTKRDNSYCFIRFPLCIFLFDHFHGQMIMLHHLMNCRNDYDSDLIIKYHD